MNLLVHHLGMDVAIAIMKAVETLGGQPSAQDYRLLATGARTEQNAAAALEICRRCHSGRELNGERPDASTVYVEMADVCLSAGGTDEADECLEIAESYGVKIAPQIYSRLHEDLNGKPRRSQVASKLAVAQFFA